jgi:rhamnose transport system permease protein
MSEPKPFSVERFSADTFSVEQPLSRRLFPNREWIQLLVLAFEIGVFSLAGTNFFTRSNAAELVRLSVEIGLLALALTPVIITGGIDLSVGSMMGLSAVIFGILWRDAGMPVWLAASAVLVLGVIGGALNATLVARLGLPSLIVTLGSYSLFRGLAEGLTRGIDNYTGFPERFLYLGQGFLGGVVPVQSIVLLLALVAYWVLVHWSVYGRALYAIGSSAEGARYAGLPVGRRLGLVYLLSGLTASLAAIIYVSHLGQAKADAGTDYELKAITAVVLGGTSIFGGRGSILGTVFGLFAIVILQNGLRLAGVPAEIGGILTGVLLISTILMDRLHQRASAPALGGPEEIRMKNSQIAVLSAVIILAALIVAASNWLLVRSLRQEGLTPRSVAGAALISPNPGRKKAVIAMMPKAKGDPYFISCRKGAQDAASELGVDLVWDGPTDLDPAKQNEVVEAWITKGVDCIAVSVENQAGISTVLRKARAKGIRVITWDADSEPDARDFLINQATPQGIGYALTDEAGRILGGRGEFAIITASLSAANQNEWIKHIKARLGERYPGMKLVAIQPSDGDRDRAFAETQTLLKVYPNVKLIMGIAAPAVPGAAEAVKQSGRSDVKVIGLSLPDMCKAYVHDGIIDSVVLWNTVDLGYLTVYAGQSLVDGDLKAGASSLSAGRLGNVEVRGDEVMLGAPFIFNKDNIDKFNF